MELINHFNTTCNNTKKKRYGFSVCQDWLCCLPVFKRAVLNAQEKMTIILRHNRFMGVSLVLLLFPAFLGEQWKGLLNRCLPHISKQNQLKWKKNGSYFYCPTEQQSSTIYWFNVKITNVSGIGSSEKIKKCWQWKTEEGTAQESNKNIVPELDSSGENTWSTR